MRTNKQVQSVARTYEGAPSVSSTAVQELRRAVMACMLFEDQFYESGEDAATRIDRLTKQVSFEDAAAIAIDARTKMKLRHVPVLLAVSLIRAGHNGRQVGDLIYDVIQRPDEMGELVSLYWKGQPDAPFTSQMKIGLARAFGKFTEYQLAKWSKDRSSAVRLRDILFLSHARPEVLAFDGPDWGAKFTRRERKVLRQGDWSSHRPAGFSGQEILYGKVAHDMLATPDTWEVALSGGADKKEAFTRLILNNTLGALALLRNLRGMVEAGVSDSLIRIAIDRMKTERVLPFRFISAARYAPRFEFELEGAMLRCLEEQPRLTGKTALLIDHSGSMAALISAKSEISRFDAAAALAMILREKADSCRVFTFAEECIEVPPRRGFALRDAVKAVVDPVSTKLGKAVKHVYDVFPECDRIIVLTDEQSADRPPHPQGRGYIINVAGYKQGIGYGPWVTIDGWSEAVLDYILEHEAAE